MIVLGVDVGFAACGWALLDVGATSERVVGMGVVRTKKATAKQHVLSCSDDMARAREIAAQLADVIDAHRASVVAIEAMSFVRSSSAMAKLGMAYGVIAALVGTRGLPLVQASPQAVKKSLCGAVTASKEEVEFAVLARYGNTTEHLLRNVCESMHVHAFDAAAVGVVALDSEVVRALRRAAA